MPAPARATRGALLGRQRAARAAEHARDLGGEVPAAREHLVRRRRRRPGGRRRAGSRGWRTRPRTRRRGWRRSSRLGARQARGERVAARRVHPARRLVEQQDARRAASRTSSSADRCRSPPETSRGWRPASSEPGTSAPIVSCIRWSPGCCVSSAVGGRGPCRGSASMQPGDRLQQRRLARPVAAHQRDRLARVGVQRDAAQDRGPVAQLDPHVLDGEQRRRAARAARPRARARARASPPAARLAVRPSRAARAPRAASPLGSARRPASPRARGAPP